MVCIILGSGFEEAEAFVPCDLLRRAGEGVLLAGIGSLEITGGHGITVRADCLAEEIDWSQTEMVILPGGLGGVSAILGSDTVLNGVKALAEREGAYIAAICAAPTVLARLGLLLGRRATCYPGMEAEMSGAVLCDEAVVRDGRYITARAAGAAQQFGLALVEVLRGTQTMQKVADGIVAR